MTAFVTLWRIGADTPEYVSDDLSGAGARHTGGRWNRPGVPLVYAATSRALACLETLVHLTPGALPLNRYLVEIQVPMAAWQTAAEVDPMALVGWDALPAGKVSLAWGSAWAESRAQLLARVPSIVIPEEWCVLINPEHPGAHGLTAKKIRRWTYDSRFAGRVAIH